MKRISIIIPHRNTPTLLFRCLNSIPNSDIFQIIVVDDHSDNCILTLDSFKDYYNDIKYISLDTNKGAGFARNVGISLAKGDWLLFADSDDYFTPNMESILRKYIDSSFEMVMFKAYSVDSQTLEISNRNNNINSKIDKVLANEITAQEASISVQSPWCRLIKKEFIIKNNITFDEIMACNDTMFTTKCTCLSNRIIVSNEYLYVITDRNGSLWNSRKTDYRNLLLRIETQIKRNKFVEPYGFEKVPILGYVLQARVFGVKILMKAIWIAVKNRSLFSNLKSYIK